MALWGGRFEEGVDDFTQRFGASLEVDKNMAEEDIAGSRAHAAMLAAQGIITPEDAAAIDAGLANILAEIQAGTFVYDYNDEDIHMAVEGELTRRIGEPGKRLHTGRSRNDQVATDAHLLAKRLCKQLMAANVALREALVAAAEAHPHTLMPGFTHLQHAQPVLFAHHMLAYCQMFARDFSRLVFAYDQADECPLGAAALAGTTYPLDRHATAEALGFARVAGNSLDAVSNRDFLLDLDYACATHAMHLSRLAEEIILWSTSEFAYITLSDSYSTGSSIMPQKKNPDFAELIRGKSGRVYGSLMGLLTVMKGLPLAYNKDMQEDKAGAIDAAATVADCMRCAAGMISTMQVNEDAMLAAAGRGHLAATDVADYLAKRGLPFREAHAVVGHLVLLCEKRGCNLDDLTLEDFRAESPLFEEDITTQLDLRAIANARTTYGGTAEAAVATQLQEVKTRLAQDATQTS